MAQTEAPYGGRLTIEGDDEPAWRVVTMYDDLDGDTDEASCLRLLALACASVTAVVFAGVAVVRHLVRPHR